MRHWELFTHVCHHTAARASTVSLKSKAMVWVQVSGLMLLCWNSLHECMHRRTHRQLWKKKDISCWANLWRQSCTKNSYLLILTFTGEQHPSPSWDLSFKNNPINSAGKAIQQSQRLFNNLCHFFEQLRGIQNEKLRLEIFSLSLCHLWTQLKNMKLEPQTRTVLHAG